MRKAVTLVLWLIIITCFSFISDAGEQQNTGAVLLSSVSATIPYDLINKVKECATDGVSSTVSDMSISQNEISTMGESEPAIQHTEEDVYLLAQLISSEAGIESPSCQAYVASVVINRLNSPEFPNTINDVIFDRKFGVQFSVTLRNKNGNRPIDTIPSDLQIEIARYCLNNGSVLPSDVLVFYSTRCDSGWVTSRKKYTQIDHTVFSYVHK